MGKTKTIEQKVSETVLQETTEVKIGGVTYNVAPPSLATLILVSEAISTLPPLRNDPEHVTEECLGAAKDFSVLGDILAILILGAKNLDGVKKEAHRVEKRYLWGLVKRTHIEDIEVKVNKKEELAQRIREDMTLRELQNLFARLLYSMQLGDFFGLTTFLTEVNLLRQTKVEN